MKKINLKNLKAADKPRKRELLYQAPRQKVRKAGVYAFWAIFIFAILMLLGGRSASEGTAQPEPTEAEVNPATGTAAGEFAKRFATEYFTWSAEPEGWENRKARLEPLLATGLDEQAGLVIADQELDSVVDSTRVVEIEATGKQQAMILVEVKQSLSGEDEGYTSNHIFGVPVAYNGTFGVYDLPTFEGLPNQTTVDAMSLEGNAVESKVEMEIKNFLPTFFESYTTDTPDKLAYFLEADVVQGLEGKLVFVELGAVQVVDGNGDYNVKAEAIVQDPKSKTSYLATYRLTVKKDEDRFIVTTINEGNE